MTANMYQDDQGHMSAVGEEMKTHMPAQTAERKDE